MSRRRSDRWLTPAVVIVMSLCASAVVAFVATLVTWMVARGLDPSPVVQLAGTAGAGLVSLGTLVLQLVGRRSQTRTEKHAGVVAYALAPDLYPENSPTPLPAVGNAAAIVPTEQMALDGYVDPEVMQEGARRDRGLPPVPPPSPRRRGVHSWPDHWPEATGNGPDAAGEAENRAR